MIASKTMILVGTTWERQKRESQKTRVLHWHSSVFVHGSIASVKSGSWYVASRILAFGNPPSLRRMKMKMKTPSKPRAVIRFVSITLSIKPASKSFCFGWGVYLVCNPFW